MFNEGIKICTSYTFKAARFDPCVRNVTPNDWQVSAGRWDDMDSAAASASQFLINRAGKNEQWLVCVIQVNEIDIDENA